MNSYWYNSAATRQELFDRLQYQNLMYMVKGDNSSSCLKGKGRRFSGENGETPSGSRAPCADLWGS
jgi:hypothetical protein